MRKGGAVKKSKVQRRGEYISYDHRAGGAIEELYLEGRDTVEEIKLEERRCTKGVMTTETEVQYKSYNKREGGVKGT